jgi:DNA processing protein
MTGGPIAPQDVAHTGNEVAAATLVCLPKMTPTRLRALLDHFGTAEVALGAVIADRVGPQACDASAEVRRSWRDRADPVALRRRLEARGTHVWLEGTHAYPILDAVPDRPAVLLAEGRRPEVLAGPRVAVVGTRAATPHGLADARELGAFLAGEGVTVVSGLAIGIDAAAHDGAIDAGGGAVGVVATGLDVTYPRRHAVLYDRVRSAGLVVAERGFGVGPLPGLFPVRNRIIAALADVVVVVEATLRGGARITAQFALDYGRSVLAVPGSRRNPAAAGTNALIADGAHPLVDWSDVLVALGMTTTGPPRISAPPSRPAPSPKARAVLDALGGEPANPDQVASRSRLSPQEVAVALAELERSGWTERAQGLIWPR